MKLHASCISCDQTEGTATLGFADDELNPSQYVLLQKTLEPDQQDKELGHDGLYVEISSQAHSAYAALAQARLEEGRLVLRLDPATARKICDSNDIEITFAASREKLQDVADVLKVLVGNQRLELAFEAEG
jgi:hypothetical protein